MSTAIADFNPSEIPNSSRRRRSREREGSSLIRLALLIGNAMIYGWLVVELLTR
jgi:hypothetical protein